MACKKELHYWPCGKATKTVRKRMGLSLQRWKCLTQRYINKNLGRGGVAQSVWSTHWPLIIQNILSKACSVTCAEPRKRIETFSPKGALKIFLNYFILVIMNSAQRISSILTTSWGSQATSAPQVIDPSPAGLQSRGDTFGLKSLYLNYCCLGDTMGRKLQWKWAREGSMKST